MLKSYKEFIDEANKDLNKQNADKAIHHDWATHIYHPRLGELKVEDHDLLEDGTITTYWVNVNGEELELKAEDVKVTKFVPEGHGGQASSGKGKKAKKV